MQRQLGGALLRNAYRLALEEDELVWHDDAKQEVFYNELRRFLAPSQCQYPQPFAY